MEEQTVLQRYLDVLRRRKWIVAVGVLITPAATLVFSLAQSHSYRASAEVLLSHQDLAAALTNTTDPTLNQLPDRYAQTQAELAGEPSVAERVLSASQRAFRDARVKPWTVLQFQGASDATPMQNADLLELKVTAQNPELARELARSYAHQFAAYRRQLDVAGFRSAMNQLDTRLAALAAAHQTNSQLYTALRAKKEQIGTLEALQTTSQVVRDPDQATQVQPRPVRNAAVGFVLGSLLAIALVMIVEALDTRVRSGEEVGPRLGLSLLGRVPKPSRKLRDDQLVTLAAPNSFDADAFRLLRANFELANEAIQARTIMVTSAVAGEGKSTTAANLAVALAWTGKRVVLVDLDLRRPILHRFFGLDKRKGLTSVALGDCMLEEALMLVPINKSYHGKAPSRANYKEHVFANWQEHAPRPVATASSNGQGEDVRALEVLPIGPLPPDPGNFIGTLALDRVLARLYERADFVIVDAPPMLAGSDGLILGGKVDACVVVAKLDAASRPVLTELRRLLETAPAVKLGYIMTGTPRTEAYGYGYGYRYDGFSHSGTEADSAQERGDESVHSQ